MNPVAGAATKPLLNPLAKSLPVKFEPNRLVNPLVGSVMLDWLCSPRNGLSTPPMLWKLLLNAFDTSELRPVLPNWKFLSDEARLVELAPEPKRIGWSCEALWDAPGKIDSPFP